MFTQVKFRISYMKNYNIDYIEIYTPMAKSLAYWHTEALGFTVCSFKNSETGVLGLSSYVLRSGEVTLVITSTYPSFQSANNEVSSFIATNYCGVKRIALNVPSVTDAFDLAINNGAFPIKFPSTTSDEDGSIHDAAIKLYDNSEITFINRDEYFGNFKPGYRATKNDHKTEYFNSIDHIASEVRINEMSFWTNYLENCIGTSLVQKILKGIDNKTGMMLNINQTLDKKLTFVIAEPSNYKGNSKVQQNIDAFGPGIHHIAFRTNDLITTTQAMLSKNVEFINFPASYYDLLRSNPEFKNIDIDALQRLNILCDKEDETLLFQKFIKPISDRPFFLYEIVERVNGYSGFALKNINVLKKAEEIEIMKVK